MRNTSKHNLFRLISLALLIIISFSTFSQDNNSSKNKMVVVIDAGHGGKDPGAMGPKGNEKDLVLAVALKVGKYIEENLKDVKVIYTRNTDVFVELYRRAQIANKANADFFISIHANSNKSSKPFGAETYIMGLHRSASNLAVAKKENSVILQEDDYEVQYEGFDPNSAEGQIIFSLYQNEYLNQSVYLAGEIQKQFKNRVGRHDRGVKQAGFWVLYKTVKPSVLIELGFVSNPEEAKFLFSEQGSDYMASAIYRAFKDYKKQTFDEEIISDQKEQKKEVKKANIVYKIQIATMNKEVKIKAQKFKGLKGVSMYKDGNSYKYFYGNETDYSKVAALQEEARKKYPDAFAVAFKDGKKISIKEAKSYNK